MNVMLVHNSLYLEESVEPSTGPLLCWLEALHCWLLMGSFFLSINKSPTAHSFCFGEKVIDTAIS
ncbi:hypothetical protein ACS0TY_001601 [Phlomoides rotata]